MQTRQRSISVLMFPWLAHGHTSPFLELAKKLTKREFYIYFCSTPVNLSSIKPKLSPKFSRSIQFVELHLPSLPDLPPHLHTTKGLPPHLMNTLKKAFDMASPSFLDILRNLKPDLLIYDVIQPWAPALASSLNIPAVHFLVTSAAVASFLLHFLKNPDEEFPFPAICLQGYRKKKFNQAWLEASSSFTDGPKDPERALQCFERSSNVILVKTLQELEGKYLYYFSALLRKKTIPVGPLVQDPGQEDEVLEVMEWLDKKKKASTVFVSFGSEYFLSEEDREEIAYGLELSKVNFIWVIRFPAGDEKLMLEEILPKGYLDRVSDTGLVVQGWAPQAKILGHPSIAGFVSHCGWSSVMESMKFGVPVIAMPMQLDQPFNARLLEEIGVGIEVNNGPLEREEMAKIIRKVVVEKSGDYVRKKAREMSDLIRNKGEEEMDEVVNELVYFCNMRTKA